MNNIKELRLKNKITQKSLARSLSVGQSTVAMWESGANMPRADKLPKLAAALGCTINDLFKCKKGA